MLVFWRIFHRGTGEIGYEEEAVFDRKDCCGFEAGGDGDGRGRPDPANRDLGTDLPSLEEAVWRSPV